MKKKTKWTLSIIGIFILLLAVQIYRVDIRKVAWDSPREGVNVYAALDGNGHISTYTFLPENKLLISLEGFCLQMAEFEGRKGNQFFDVLWKTNIPGRHWAQDFDYVEKGYRPVSLKMSVMENNGDNCAGFTRPGKTIYKYLEFSDTKMKADGKVFVLIKKENLGNLKLDEVLEYVDWE